MLMIFWQYKLTGFAPIFIRELIKEGNQDRHWIFVLSFWVYSLITDLGKTGWGVEFEGEK